jgi:CheY-like chemotaxis protein
MKLVGNKVTMTASVGLWLASPNSCEGDPLRILLAEDSRTNQLLAVRLLEKRGHKVRVANNGREAVDALQTESFDLILMDVQMPEMSGIEATAVIRERERRDSNSRIPIIAMTAHAMKGDRELCIQAGMDGYVTKPVRPDALFQALEQFVPRSIEASDSTSDSNDDPIIDPTALLKQFNGDIGFFKDIFKLFMEDVAGLMCGMRDATNSKDSRMLERMAHKFKGSVANFHSDSVATAADRLESFGRCGDFSSAAKGLIFLEKELSRLIPALIEFGNDAHTMLPQASGPAVRSVPPYHG